MKRRRVVTAIAAAFWLLPMPGRAADPWSCDSGAFRVTQNAGDIAAGARTAATTFSAHAFAEAGFAIARQELDSGDTQSVTMERKFSVVSLVGPLLALRDEAYVEYSGTAHPGGETRFWTIDLRRSGAFNLSPDDPFSVTEDQSGRLVDLRALFSAADIRTALASDPFVRRMVNRPSATLDDLLQALGDGAGLTGTACFSVPADVLSSFAVVGVDGAGVGARVGLPGAGPCRYNLTQLGLRLAPRGPIAALLSPEPPSVCRPPAGTPALDLTFSARR